MCHLRVIKSNLRCSYNYLKTSTVDYDHPRDYAKVTLEVTMLQGANVLLFALEYNVGLSNRSFITFVSSLALNRPTGYCCHPGYFSAACDL